MHQASQQGVTIVETIVFIVVVSIALVALLKVFSQSIGESVDPVVRLRAMELAQAKLDEILARKFDENTATGSVPRCGSVGALACAGIAADSDFDDVGDFNGFTDNTFPGHNLSVTVVNGGLDLGLGAADARLITVTVTYGNDQLALSAYKVNF